MNLEETTRRVESGDLTVLNTPFGTGRGWYATEQLTADRLTVGKFKEVFEASDADPDAMVRTSTQRDVDPWLITIIVYEKEGVNHVNS